MGNIGSGKTLSMTRFGYVHYLKGYKVFANYHLEFPHEKVTPEFLEQIVKGEVDLTGNNIFLLDEIQMYIDSRSSANKRNRIISYFIMQIRKKKIILCFTAQMEHTIDKRLRELCQNKIECSIVDVKVKKEDGTLGVIKVSHNKHYVNDGYGMKELGNNYYLSQTWFKYYDTSELITA